MTRVVLDANYAGRGHFNETRLVALAATVAGGEVDFVIPEVVVWEWAEHAAAAADALVEERRRFPVSRALFAIPPMPDRVETSDLVALVVAGLPPGFAVWSPSVTDWKDAVEAQVLQTGAGERREGVKTGAADHIVLGCVRDQLDNRNIAEAVVLATSDRHLKRVCQRLLGDELLFASNDRELLARLIEFRPAAEDLSEAVEEQLSDRIRWGSDIQEALTTLSMGFNLVGSTAKTPTTERLRAGIRTVDIVELHDLEVGEFAAGERVGTAQVRIFGEVDLEELTLDRVGTDDVEWISTWSGRIDGAMIDIPLTVTFDRDWSITSSIAAGEATIDLNPGDDSDES